MPLAACAHARSSRPHKARLITQVIKYQSTPDKVETAELHIIEPVGNIEEMRITAMHHCSPVHNFMFDCEGKLLSANKAATQACRNSTSGELSIAFKNSDLLLNEVHRPETIPTAKKALVLRHT